MRCRSGQARWKTYLGHKDICSTLVYLTASDDLLRYASERFKQYHDTAQQAIGGQQ
jgi:hypothetical protein